MAGRRRKKTCRPGNPDLGQPYRIPGMAQIAEVPWNGRTAVSTFSGCGGSCLGYRMAGFKVLWASEFVQAAAEVYRLNHPGSSMDTRDIRKVKPSEILKRIGRKRGDVDLLDGSPPCASFSMSGKREATWGEVRKYSETHQRVDDLFFEFTRILKGIQPRAFVAENVKGLVIGKAKGCFKEILRGLKSCGYRVSARVLDAQWLGVPQRRQRLIFIGTRADLGVEPRHPSPFQSRYVLRDACPWITEAVYDTSGQHTPVPFTADDVCPTILQLNPCHYKGLRAEHDADEVVANFEGMAIHPEWKKLKPGAGSDRYFNLVKAHPDKPCNTVTQTGGQVAAASVTHPFKPRKFTIPELRRICGFPDDFKLTGSFSQQWERLGRAVPPPMSYAIGRSVFEALCEADSCAG